MHFSEPQLAFSFERTNERKVKVKLLKIARNYIRRRFLPFHILNENLFQINFIGFLFSFFAASKIASTMQNLGKLPRKFKI